MRNSGMIVMRHSVERVTVEANIPGVEVKPSHSSRLQSDLRANKPRRGVLDGRLGGNSIRYPSCPVLLSSAWLGLVYTCTTEQGVAS